MKISEYPTVNEYSGDELIPCIINGVNKNINSSVLRGTAVYVNVNDFGADPTGVADSTDAVNAAILSLGKTSPTGYFGWGQGTINFPEGKYLINGTIGAVDSPPAVIGLRIIGAGCFATSIIRTVDTGDLWNMDICIDLEISDMSFIHVPTDVRANWTTNLFTIHGEGGGRRFRLNRIHTKNFNRVINQTGTGNGDTNDVSGCFFDACTVFLESENTQAVINSFNNCTWSGAIEKVFYVAGFHRTSVSEGNVVVDGTLLYLKNISAKWSSGAEFIFNNVKLEWTTAHAAETDVPKLLHASGNYISASVEFNSCGLKGGFEPHENSRSFFVDSPIELRINGGTFGGKPAIGDRLGYLNYRICGVYLNSVEIASPDHWIMVDNSISGGSYPPVIFNRCVFGTQRITDLTMCLHDGVPIYMPQRCMMVGTESPIPVYYASTSLSMPVYGQSIIIDKLLLVLRSNLGDDVKTINIYSDSAKQNIVGTYEIPAGAISGNDNYVNIPITGNELTRDGVYIDLIMTDGNFVGHFGIYYTCI